MNKRRKCLLASVLDLQNSSFIYPSCQKCFSRIILLSKRSNCPKCDFTGEAENVSYRYKLSLKVTESNQLFGITVFGSCLDKYFGLTATDLHRFIQDPNGILRVPGSDTTQNLLTKAVKTCFVGQSFIFGVTNFENQPGQGSKLGNFFKQYPDGKREVKALVACQMISPYPGVSGFTVIDYFHQLLQLSDLKKLSGSSQEPYSQLLALEHSNNDPSSINDSDSSSSVFESQSRNNFSRSWQPPIECISVFSQLTDDSDFSATESSKAVDTHHQKKKHTSFAKATRPSNCYDSIQGSWNLASSVDNAAQKLSEEFDLQASHPSAVPMGHHKADLTHSNLSPLKMQEPFETNTKSDHGAVEIKIRYSQHELTYHQHHGIDNTGHFQGKPTCYIPSSQRVDDMVDGPKDCDPEIWDNLPFSESLNEFLAAIENEIALSPADTSSRKNGLDNDNDKLHADYSKLPMTPLRTARKSHKTPTHLRSEAIVKNVTSKDADLPTSGTSPNPSVQKESQLDDVMETVLVNNRDVSECFLPGTDLSALFPSSTGLETTGINKSPRIPSNRAKISHKLSTSASDCCSFSIRDVNECEKLLTLYSKKYNDISYLDNLENHQRPQNQDDSFTVCQKLTFSLEALCSMPDGSTNTWKEMPDEHINDNLTQSHCTGHEGSYNASADLFDDSANEMDIAADLSKKSQDILLHWGTSFAESHTKSDLVKSLSENSNQSSPKVSMQNQSISPLAFHCNSEYDFESQDFIPCSQSTPIARFHQARIHGVKEAFEKIPAYHSVLECSYKKARISSENNRQPTISDSPKSINKVKQKTKSSVICTTQPEVLSCLPPSEHLETDTDEWVPPSTRKALLSEEPGFQGIGLRRCLASCNSPDQKELPVKKMKYSNQRTEKHLVKEFRAVFKEITSPLKIPNSASSSCNSKESALEHGSCLEVKYCLPYSENKLFSVPETKIAWSPELFS